MYTQLCREIASCGTIVVAVEHEDGSAHYATSGSTGKYIEYKQPPPGAEVVEFRHPFLEHRAGELQGVVAGILAIASGDQKADVDPKWPSAAAEHVLRDVLSNGDASCLFFAGHSFGGACVLRYFRRLRERSERCPFLGAILVDLWGEPLVNDDIDRGVPIPFSVLLSESWKAGGAPTNRRLVNAGEGPEAIGCRCLAAVYVRGTDHTWVSELPFFLRQKLARRLGLVGSADVVQAHKETAQAVCRMLAALMDAAAADGATPQPCTLQEELCRAGSLVAAAFD